MADCKGKAGSDWNGLSEYNDLAEEQVGLDTRGMTVADIVPGGGGPEARLGRRYYDSSLM